MFALVNWTAFDYCVTTTVTTIEATMIDHPLVCAFLFPGLRLVKSLFLNCCWIFKYYLNLDYCLRMKKFPSRAFLLLTVFSLRFSILRFQTSTYSFSAFYYQATSQGLDRIQDCHHHCYHEAASLSGCCSWRSFRSRSSDRICSSWVFQHSAPALSVPSVQQLFLSQSLAISCASGMSDTRHPTIRTSIWWRCWQLRR